MDKLRQLRRQKLLINNWVIISVIVLSLGSCTKKTNSDSGEKSVIDTSNIINKNNKGNADMDIKKKTLAVLKSNAKFFSFDDKKENVYLSGNNGCIEEFNLISNLIKDTCKEKLSINGYLFTFYKTPFNKIYSFGYDTDVISKIVTNSKDTLTEENLIVTDVREGEILFNELEMIEPSARILRLQIETKQVDTFPIRGKAFFYSEEPEYIIIQQKEDGASEIAFYKQGLLESIDEIKEPVNMAGINKQRELLFLYSGSGIYVVDKGIKQSKKIYSGLVNSAIFNDNLNKVYGIEFNQKLNQYEIFEIQFII